MLSAQFKSSTTVLTATQPVDFVAVLVAGIFITIRSLPAYVSWARFVSVFYYCHELLAIAYWRHVDTIGKDLDHWTASPRTGNRVTR